MLKREHVYLQYARSVIGQQVCGWFVNAAREVHCVVKEALVAT